MEKETYPSFNSLNRPALAMGVPLMVLLAHAFITLALAGLGFFLFKLLGLLMILLISGLILFVLRFLCENDPNALTSLQSRLKGFFVTFLFGKKGVVSFSIISNSKKINSNTKNEIKKYI